ncbi:MAG: homoserine kinase [Thermotogaceae bacterium]|nr:homoserine kinase [Thermotogaceae bacterium]MDN5337941.1 homoserine kinase [Thermotogaceae bacterium]
MKGLVKVPATSANLGAGFDVFGIALEFFNVVEFDTKTDGWHFENEGDYSHQIKDYSLFEKVFNEFQRLTKIKIPEVKIVQKCNIPVSRGLGSSAAVIVSATIIANQLTGRPLEEAEMIKFAVDIEGHPDNVVPAFTGGLVVSYFNDQMLEYEVFKEIDFGELVFAIPNFQLSTEKMRKVLPKTVKREDAVLNLKNATQFLAKISHGKYKEALKYTLDELHQKYRINSSRKMKKFVDSILSKKPEIFFLSGSGPTVCTDISDLDDIPYLEKIIKTKISKTGASLELFT